MHNCANTSWGGPYSLPLPPPVIAVGGKKRIISYGGGGGGWSGSGSSTAQPTTQPTSAPPTTLAPTTLAPTRAPTSEAPTEEPTEEGPLTFSQQDALWQSQCGCGYGQYGPTCENAGADTECGTAVSYAHIYGACPNNVNKREKDEECVE